MKKEDAPEWKKRLREIEGRAIEKPLPCKHAETFVDIENNDLVCSACFKILRFGSKDNEEELEKLLSSRSTLTYTKPFSNY